MDIENLTKYQQKMLIKKKTDLLVKESNKIWNDVVKNRDLEDEYQRLIKSPEAVALPVIYVLIKTHKNTAESFRSFIDLQLIKVRPIISCVDSPTERLSWLVTKILKPLLKEIPTHLGSLCEHLEVLKAIPKDQLVGKKLFTADIAALYTNVNVQSCIDDVIELASEHLEKLDLLGLQLTDVHKILLHVLSNSFFAFDSTLWQQMDGLFMGLRPGPFLAVIRVYKFVKCSIYIDAHFLSTYLAGLFKLYIDDALSAANTKQQANQTVQSISDQDPDGKLSWTVDFPENNPDFTPYLHTEVRAESDGSITTRLYRKPQQKDITLHRKSHHPTSVKTSTLINLYREAEKVSSDREQRNYSLKRIDELLEQNGYTEPRKSYNKHSHKRRRIGSEKDLENKTILKLEFVSDSISNKIRNYIKKNKLPIKVTFTPGTKLKTLLCCNRPYDRNTCFNNSCKICPLITTKNRDCQCKNVVYKVTCKICGECYIGECSRCAHERLGEHLRYATYPTTPSNTGKSFAMHYNKFHKNVKPDLEFDILRIESNTVRRKIFEAMYILKYKPTINVKEELDTIHRFVVSVSS